MASQTVSRTLLLAKMSTAELCTPGSVTSAICKGERPDAAATIWSLM